jgi:sirohydrochlorin ferrochelatase
LLRALSTSRRRRGPPQRYTGDGGKLAIHCLAPVESGSYRILAGPARPSGIGFVLSRPMIHGFILFAHGSRLESANQGVRAAASELARLGSFRYVEPAFLELGTPDLAGAVARLVERGVHRILVIPYFLTLGVHLERDLPQIISGLAAAHPGIQIQVAPPLEGHPALLRILLDRVNEYLTTED